MTSPYGPMVLICNTRSARRGLERTLEEVRTHLHGRGLEHEVRYTTRSMDATTIARSALEADVRFLVAVGGDGTVHEVVNGMMADDRALNPESVLGVVAAGRGADFIKTFGIPAMPGHAVAHLDGPESFLIDIGKVTFRRDGAEVVRYFANIAEVGLGARVARRAARLPSWLGPTVYLVAFWLTIAGHRPAEVEVDLVDRTYAGPMNNLIVANGQFFRGGMKIAPRAAPTDGLLDVMIEHARKLEAIAVMPKVFKGEHLPHPDIKLAKRVKVSITARLPLLLEADGEVLGETPATFEVLPEALRLKV
ncbi:MAG: diacylglycerol kinase family protein [Actinomycetota bacterium]